MRSYAGASFVAVVITSIVACTRSGAEDDSHTPALKPVGSSSCTVENAPPVLSTALCSGDSTQIVTALDSLKVPNNAPYLAQIPVLERIWRRDRSLGRHLPWTALESTAVRVVVAERLAPQIVLGRSDVPLSELQELAVQVAPEDAAAGVSQGIKLIGVTHAPGQVKFLEQVLASTKEASQRYTAIDALGMVCDAEAKDALERLRTLSAANAQEVRWIDSSLRMHETLDTTTCPRILRK